jgi:hypothetical protein
MQKQIISLLNQKVKQYNHISFIENDPVCIPHLFTQKQDIEYNKRNIGDGRKDFKSSNFT